MFTKRFYSGIIAMLIFSFSAPLGFAAQSAPQTTKQLEKIRHRVSTAGPKTQLSVKFNDKTAAKGYVSKITNEGFELTDKRGTAIRAVSYTEIKSIGGRFPTKLVIIGAASAIVGVVIITEAMGVGCECR